jgi:hypothetical protein
MRVRFSVQFADLSVQPPAADVTPDMTQKPRTSNRLCTRRMGSSMDSLDAAAACLRGRTDTIHRIQYVGKGRQLSTKIHSMH